MRSGKTAVGVYPQHEGAERKPLGLSRVRESSGESRQVKSTESFVGCYEDLRVHSKSDGELLGTEQGRGRITCFHRPLGCRAEN